MCIVKVGLYAHMILYCQSSIRFHTVDGRNPAPVDRLFIPLFIGFQPFKVVQDFATIHRRDVFLSPFFLVNLFLSRIPVLRRPSTMNPKWRWLHPFYSYDIRWYSHFWVVSYPIFPYIFPLNLRKKSMAHLFRGHPVFHRPWRSCLWAGALKALQSHAEGRSLKMRVMGWWVMGSQWLQWSNGDLRLL